MMTTRSALARRGGGSAQLAAAQRLRRQLAGLDPQVAEQVRAVYLLGLRIQFQAEFPTGLSARADDHELQALMVKPLGRVELREPPAAEPVAEVLRQIRPPPRPFHPGRSRCVRIADGDDVARLMLDSHRR